MSLGVSAGFVGVGADTAGGTAGGSEFADNTEAFGFSAFSGVREGADDPVCVADFACSAGGAEAAVATASFSLAGSGCFSSLEEVVAGLSLGVSRGFSEPVGSGFAGSAFFVGIDFPSLADSRSSDCVGASFSVSTAFGGLSLATSEVSGSAAIEGWSFSCTAFLASAAFSTTFDSFFLMGSVDGRGCAFFVSELLGAALAMGVVAFSCACNVRGGAFVSGLSCLSCSADERWPALAAVGLVIRDRKPLEGGAECFFSACVSLVFCSAGFDDVDEASDIRGLEPALAMLVLVDDEGFTDGFSSSCLALEEAVPAINREGIGTGLVDGLGPDLATVLPPSLFSGSCFAADDAVGFVRCEGRLTGLVGDLGLDLLVGEVVVDAIEGRGGSLALLTVLWRGFAAVGLDAVGVFGELLEEADFVAAPEGRALVEMGAGLALVCAAVVLLAVLSITDDGHFFRAAPPDTAAVDLVSTGFNAALSSSSAETDLSGCSLCLFWSGSGIPGVLTACSGTASAALPLVCLCLSSSMTVVFALS